MLSPPAWGSCCGCPGSWPHKGCRCGCGSWARQPHHRPGHHHSLTRGGPHHRRHHHWLLALVTGCGCCCARGQGCRLRQPHGVCRAAACPLPVACWRLARPCPCCGCGGGCACQAMGTCSTVGSAVQSGNMRPSQQTVLLIKYIASSTAACTTAVECTTADVFPQSALQCCLRRQTQAQAPAAHAITAQLLPTHTTVYSSQVGLQCIIV